MRFQQFLAQQNIEFSAKRYGLDAVNFMALGLFSSLIIGLILKNLGTWLGAEFLVDVGTQAQAAMGAAVGVGAAFGLKAPPLVLFASVITGLAGASAGGVVGAFVAAAVGAEFGKLLHKITPIDIIITPAATLIAGLLSAQFFAPIIAAIMASLGEFIMWAVELQPIVMSVIVAVVMGMVLTLPISSAALAISLSLGGVAAGAATIGCAAQMVGFAVMGWRDNGVAGVLSNGLGTSMLQMPNIIKNPKIWIPPTLSGALLAPFGALFGMANVPSGAGMGTSGLVGQVGTLEAMGASAQTLVLIGLFHIVLPAILTLIFAHFMRKKGWIKTGDLRLTD
ncbi:PTS sugar transporter subunit IID [Moraxella caviae]|uniref:PTS sugar transporter subunit IID n=1 Tax=Moraxella caviae TaxID=34060 RepID=A0A1T0A1Q4_9GAMM|nr:PTS sugar transporter subunit IIC [Moraxella caviae]OOR89617.1 PTS sugar transporter subunit IID [Moraxella caviae]STZ10304.1 Predicted membrane protein, putative toxin regulator [Moraxella caviae]